MRTIIKLQQPKYTQKTIPKKKNLKGYLILAGFILLAIFLYTSFKPKHQVSNFHSQSVHAGESRFHQNSLKKNVASQSGKTQTYSGFCIQIPIFLYHHVEPSASAKAAGQEKLYVDNQIFEQQMSYLAQKGYTTLTLDELSQDLIKHQRLGGKNISLTFDDGYADFYTYAYPVIKKYNLKANLFIPTGLINNPGYLTWDQLQEMVGSQLVTAYDHTYSHAALTNVSSDKLKFEVNFSKQQLGEKLGKKVNIFAYPYGASNQNVVDFLKANDFIAAYSTIPGYVECDSFIMNLHRNRVGNAQLSSYGL